MFYNYDATEKSVIMLDIRDDWLVHIRQLVMSVGIEVFYGPNSSDISQSPLLFVDQDGYKRCKSSGYIESTRTLHPGACLCIITDVSCPSEARHYTDASQYNNIFEVLTTADVNFISALEV